MLYFMNDYQRGAHPIVLQALNDSNGTEHVGYGVDDRTAAAAQKIKAQIGRADVDVHFLIAGTQTNTAALTHFLRPYEAVIATHLGHISVHETGAIESMGHKIMEMPTEDGKLLPSQVEWAVKSQVDEHMVLPRVVYISNATETGTIYSKAELKALRAVCDQYDLYLYLDGARLGTALTSADNDLTLRDIADLCDAFYIGGTKNGILFGEALVICNDALKPYARHTIKQTGSMLAKGWLLGVQFETLFTDDLFFELGRHANAMASALKAGILDLGYELMCPTSTNIIFVILDNDIHRELSKLCYYEAEKPYGDHSVEARFVTSWSTKPEDVTKLLELLKKYAK